MNEEEELEMVSLVGDLGLELELELEYEETPPSSPKHKTHEQRYKAKFGNSKHSHSPLPSPLRSRLGKFVILVSILCLFLGLSIVHYSMKKEKQEEKERYVENHYDFHTENNLILSCPNPNEITKAENDKNEMLIEFYDNLNTYNSSDGDGYIDLDELKKSTYDGWEHNYNELKEILYDWKSERFSSLKSGDRIFESGCGRGLNLLMTLEILKESKNITNILVYGVDYVPSTTHDANHILGNIFSSNAQNDMNATLGSPICRGDATNLTSFIPSNSFDIAYTGYIDPIQDPANFGRDVTREDLCLGKGTPTKKGKKDQQLVEEWYAKWVRELIRIAKPGKPIIIEQVSLPKCFDDEDWGGVWRSWWQGAATKYDWNVDVESIMMRNMFDDKKQGKRYHVYMEKTR